MAPANSPPPGGAEQSFISHLLELRDRLLRSIVTVILLLLGLMPFSQQIYTLLARPLLRHLPKGATMIATEVASPFLIPFKLTLIVAIVLAMPMILYQLWAFVAPGLYQSERRIALPLVVSSALLFYLGMAFAYYVVFPLVFAFFTGSAPEGVTVMTDISKYLDFVLTLFLAFGVAFEVPVATVLLVWVGITTPQALASKRPYVIVAAFVIGMLLTPPDVISQTLLAVPMWMLFELGLLLSRWLVRASNAAPGVADGPLDAGNGLDQALVEAEAAERRLSSAPDEQAGRRDDASP
jgi:sec-independent protein translocase protein TatC